MNNVCELLRKGMYEEADILSRKIVREYANDNCIDKMDNIINLVDNVTGGLGYTREEPLDESRMNYAGYYIAWPDVLSDNSKILEIGTGLGRTAFIVHYTIKPHLYLTIDNSIKMLYIALYRNPIEDYRRVLWEKDVKIVYGDALYVLRCINDTFDHVIHDGGPNPRKNRRIYSKYFFSLLKKLLRKNGSLSVFIGSYRVMQDFIYNTLIDLGFNVIETVSLPFSKARVIHAVKS